MLIWRADTKVEDNESESLKDTIVNTEIDDKPITESSKPKITDDQFFDDFFGDD